MSKAENSKKEKLKALKKAEKKMKKRKNHLQKIYTKSSRMMLMIGNIF